jgi:hypothetical protein
VDQENRIEKLRAKFEALDDAQKDYLLGIARALSFANASEKAAAALSASKHEGTEAGKDSDNAKKEGG